MSTWIDHADRRRFLAVILSLLAALAAGQSLFGGGAAAEAAQAPTASARVEAGPETEQTADPIHRSLEPRRVSRHGGRAAGRTPSPDPRVRRSTGLFLLIAIGTAAPG